MKLFIYDGTFAGLLTSIFESFAAKCEPANIVNQNCYQASLLDEVSRIVTDEVKAERVLKGIDARSDNKGAERMYKMFLSELPAIEIHIYRLVCLLINKNNPDILDNFANKEVLYSAQVVKMIGREVHRMHAFVRFQQATSGIYYAVISPDFNVLPLIGEHFVRRFADQSWIIFDARRNYGLYYDLTELGFIDAASLGADNLPGAPDSGTWTDTEDNYQQLWKGYFQSVNIKERNNKKLHLRHLPKRYWKYLVEKQLSQA